MHRFWKHIPVRIQQALRRVARALKAGLDWLLLEGSDVQGRQVNFEAFLERMHEHGQQTENADELWRELEHEERR
jgi:hypothetical protein